MTPDLSAHVAGGTTGQLVASLTALADHQATPATRVAAAALVEELARRHPEVVDALKAWSLDLDSDLSLIDVVIATVAA